MSSILRRVSRLLRGATPPRPTTAVGLENADTVLLGLFADTGGGRLQLYDDVERMDDECAEAAAALDTIASLASASPEGEETPFRIEWGAGTPTGAQETVEAAIRRARLGPKTFSFCRDAAKYGDAFLEVVLDDALAVVRLKHLPARQLFREEGPHGQLLDPAFTQRQYPGGAPLVAFHPWQVVHLRWSHQGERRYGRSHLAVARAIWKRLRPLEDSMRVARLERGYDKLVHYVEIPPEASLAEAQKRLEDYRRRTGARLVHNPETGAYDLLRQTPTVRTDFYVPVSRTDAGAVAGGDIKLLAADNAQLAHVEDVEYLHRQLICALRVPAAFLGFEREVNARATLAQQFAEFARTIRRAQGVLAAGYRQVLDLQLLLHGWDPARLDYRIVWPEVRVEDERVRAEAERYRMATASISPASR